MGAASHPRNSSRHEVNLCRMPEAAQSLAYPSRLMPEQNRQLGRASWRRLVICLAMLTLLLGGIRLHALHFTSGADTAISANHQSAKRQSFDSDARYCVAPPRIFAFEP